MSSRATLTTDLNGALRRACNGERAEGTVVRCHGPDVVVPDDGPPDPMDQVSDCEEPEQDPRTAGDATVSGTSGQE